MPVKRFKEDLVESAPKYNKKIVGVEVRGGRKGQLYLEDDAIIGDGTFVWVQWAE